MKITLSILCALALLLSNIHSTYSDDVHTNGKVCGNPATPCNSSKWKFEPYDLSFRLPQELKWLNSYSSASFYAIILKSKRAVPDPDGPAGDGECSGFFSEAERQSAQSLFTNNKVFASRFDCYVAGIGYTNVNYNYNILAVYAGETQAAANSFLSQVKATGRFPGANIRKMQVALYYGD